MHSAVTVADKAMRRVVETREAGWGPESCGLEKYKNPHLFIAHFHESRGWGLSNCLAALQAGVVKFDSSLGGIGGQPAAIVDREPDTATRPVT